MSSLAEAAPPESMKRKKIDVRKSLRVSIGDGVFASVMLGVTDNYVIPFALLLGATVQQVGLINGWHSLDPLCKFS
jgi:hypothetical protein